MPELLLKDEVFQVVGAAMEVSNYIKHGLHEKIYENGLVVEFGLRDIPVRKQPKFPVFYKDSLVGEFIPDLIAFDRVIVEVKTIDQITDH